MRPAERLNNLSLFFTQLIPLTSTNEVSDIVIHVIELHRVVGVKGVYLIPVVVMVPVDIIVIALIISVEVIFLQALLSLFGAVEPSPCYHGLVLSLIVMLFQSEDTVLRHSPWLSVYFMGTAYHLISRCHGQSVTRDIDLIGLTYLDGVIHVTRLKEAREE